MRDSRRAEGVTCPWVIYGIIMAAFILATALSRAEVAALWPMASD
jgi:hypothetical protein